MLVPVVDLAGTPLQPSHPAKVKRWLKEGRCTKHWHRGTFYVKLKRVVEHPNTDVVLAIDPGSKRTGITVATPKGVVLNMLVDSTNLTKQKVEKRRMYRRSRRYLKTPYRKCRSNRNNLKQLNRIPPSTLSRWNRHLRIVHSLLKILPINKVVVEDIKAVSHTSKRIRQTNKKYVSRWNAAFSPLQQGKNYFYNFLESKGIAVYKYQGWQTAKQRKKHGYKKISDKLSTKWESQCIDSHALCEMYYNKKIEPVKNLSFIEFLNFSRRELFRDYGKTRRRHGSTRTLGYNRGSLVWCSYIKRGYKKPIGLCYLAGFMETTNGPRVSLYDTKTNKELGQNFKLTNCKILTNLRYRNNFIKNEGGAPRNSSHR